MGHEIYNFCRTFLGHHYDILISSDPYPREDRKRRKTIAFSQYDHGMVCTFRFSIHFFFFISAREGWRSIWKLRYIFCDKSPKGVSIYKIWFKKNLWLFCTVCSFANLIFCHLWVLIKFICNFGQSNSSLKHVEVNII